MESPSAQGDTEGNRRRERRQRVYKRGRLVFNNGFSVFDCLVRNVSSGGAMLEMETLLGVPRSFQVIIDQGTTGRPCRVIWRTDKRMGVAFADPEVA